VCVCVCVCVFSFQNDMGVVLAQFSKACPISNQQKQYIYIYIYIHIKTLQKQKLVFMFILFFVDNYTLVSFPIIAVVTPRSPATQHWQHRLDHPSQLTGDSSKYTPHTAAAADLAGLFFLSPIRNPRSHWLASFPSFSKS
jgi:hypothetical protein